MKKNGFTLIEVIIALALTSILLAAIFIIFSSQQKIYKTQDQIVAMQQNLRVGLDRMVRELMVAGYDSTGVTSSGIVAAYTDSIRFTANLDGDGVIDANEDIEYYLYDSGSDGDLDLGRKIGGNATVQPLAENISLDGLLFSYFTSTGLELTLTSSGLSNTDMARVRRIQISLTARTERPYQNTGNYATRTMTSNVTLRN
jgi:type IV pilus assembly protein PilW